MFSGPARRRVAIGGVAALAILGAVGAVTAWTTGNPTDRPARPPAPRPVALAQPATVAPSPSPTVTGPSHDTVGRAGPTRFRFSSPGLSVDARVCAMSNARPLDPPGEQHHTVCWVREDFGEAPSSDSATTYVLGHSWAPDPLEVLNRLSAPATKELLAARPVRVNGVDTFPVRRFDGATITIWTPKGRLDYTVRDAYGVDKYDLGSLRRTMDDRVRDRVVLITCAQRKGRDYHYNVVLEAYLSASSARG